MSMRPSSHPRATWTVFAVVSALGLIACLVAAAPSGGGTAIGLTLMGGLIVIGLAAALTSAILAPMPDSVTSPNRSFMGGAVLGGGDGGGFGDGGGGGGDGGCS